jgi:hypothetical protein
MAKIIGIGGVFIRSNDPEPLYSWYEKQLGLPRSPGGIVLLPWRQADDDGREQTTVWALFPKDGKYFGPANPGFMMNYIVDDLDGMLASLRAAGAQVEERVEDSEYGRFGWVIDPEGNRIELWEPPTPSP